MELTKEFWNNRYLENEIGWDIGEISTPLKEYIDQLQDKKIKILIPGAGNSYEAEYLHNKGFENTSIIDIAPEAISSFKKRVSSFNDKNILNKDFFQLNGTYDLILEQTFFCAINKNLRSAYAKQMANLLAPSGKLVGLLFDAPMYEDHPPFGGSIKEYISYFQPYFEIEKIEPCYNSISPRAGKEAWIKMIRKQ